MEMDVVEYSSWTQNRETGIETFLQFNWWAAEHEIQRNHSTAQPSKMTRNKNKATKNKNYSIGTKT